MCNEPNTSSAPHVVPGGRELSPESGSGQSAGSAHLRPPFLCVTDPFSKVQKELPGRNICLFVPEPQLLDAGPRPWGGGTSAALCFSKPAALPRPCWASAVRGKLESDPWRWAWSPWQPRIYDRGLHPAWRTFWTFNSKREEGNQEVSRGSPEPRAAPRSPQMVSEGPSYLPGCLG